jgi:hypothetical protein
MCFGLSFCLMKQQLFCINMISIVVIDKNSENHNNCDITYTNSENNNNNNLWYHNSRFLLHNILQHNNVISLVYCLVCLQRNNFYHDNKMLRYTTLCGNDETPQMKYWRRYVAMWSKNRMNMQPCDGRKGAAVTFHIVVQIPSFK